VWLVAALRFDAARVVGCAAGAERRRVECAAITERSKASEQLGL
jgi:hypothetical protein